MKTRTPPLIVISLLLLITGCRVSKELSVAEVAQDNSRPISLKLRDGRIIKYEGGEYEVIPTDSLTMISGKGKLQPSGNSYVEPVRWDQIEAMSTSKYTPLFYFGFTLTCFGMAGFIYFITHFSSGG